MKIVSWKPEYSETFKELNLEWLQEFFEVEPHDEEVLGDPRKHIIETGGNIFFIKDNDDLLGCVALMYMEDGIFELTKMAVKPGCRGKKLGHELMTHTIAYAKSQGWSRLVIYSNRKLENAIHLYRKFGFREIPIEQNNPYSRGDIKMNLNLS